MSMTLRTAASVFLGMPPIFRRKDADRAMRRGDSAGPKTKARATPADPRVEPILRGKPASAEPAAKAPGAVDLDKLLAATRKAPVDLAIIEWDGDGATATIERAQSADTATASDEDPRGYDARCRRIRDRYIGARFPGVARSATDLESAERVVKAARLYFEDGQAETALELLDMAIEQDSRAEPLWLAQLEILFLGRSAPRFIECARAFRAMHPASEAWAEVARLGRALAPREALFGAASGPRDHDHYGPWPDLPNWIQANWDLTAEVVAADFHRILKRRAEEARASRKPQIAA
jgi:hypothetical protein